MPILKSSKKANRQNIKHRQKNYKIRERYKASVKALKSAVKSKKTDKIQELVKNAYSEIDKACKKKILHRNNASRKKSLVARLAGSIK